MRKTALAIVLVTAVTATASAEKIVIKGSDTLGAKMVPQLAEVYKAAGNGTDFEIAAEGSSTCFTNLLAGTCQLGMSSRDAKDSEKDKFTAKGKQLTEHVAAWDMIAVIVNEKNKLRGLSLEQIEGIFTGDIKNWSEVGGPDAKISIYTRNTSSGTYKSFQEMAMGKRDYGANTQKMAGNEQIASEVAKNPYGIGYVGLAYVKKDGIKTVSVDRVSPTVRNKAKYALSRKLYYYTDGTPTGEVATFLTWAIASPEAASVIEKVGFIPAAE